MNTSLNKKISWVTADYFFDVDLPIVPLLLNEYSIEWNLVFSKAYSGSLNTIKELSSNELIKCKIHKIARRLRDPRIFFEYLHIALELKKQRPDMVYLNIIGWPYFLPIARLLLGRTKIILAIHNVTTPKGAISSWFADYYTTFCIKSFKNIQVFSEIQKIALLKRSKKKRIAMIPLDLKDFGAVSVRKNEKVTFLNFGIIREYKRVDILIRAAQTVYEKTNFKFLVRIYGACESWGKYQKIIKYPEIFDICIKRIPNQDIPCLFSTSHYFVLPYQDIAQSGAVMVAYNYNIPVIASDLPVFKNCIKDKENGYLFRTGSVESLTNVMEKILANHHDNYQRVKSAQKAYINEVYSTESLKKKYMAFIDYIFKNDLRS